MAFPIKNRAISGGTRTAGRQDVDRTEPLHSEAVNRFFEQLTQTSGDSLAIIVRLVSPGVSTRGFWSIDQLPLVSGSVV